MQFLPGQRFCRACEVSSVLATCWICDGPTVAGQGPVSWNSSHTWTQARTHAPIGGLILAIEDADVAKLIES